MSALLGARVFSHQISEGLSRRLDMVLRQPLMGNVVRLVAALLGESMTPGEAAHRIRNKAVTEFSKVVKRDSAERLMKEWPYRNFSTSIVKCDVDGNVPVPQD
jgi:hypothetical protein